MIQTICIIGTEGSQGQKLAASLSAQEGYRLLLIDHISESSSKNEQETAACPVDACWEADIIVIDIPRQQVATLAKKISAVCIRKTVIHFSEPKGASAINGFIQAAEPDWKSLFPHAGIARVFIGSLASIVDATDNETEATVIKLLSDAGLNPFSNNQETTNPLNSISKVS